MKRKILGQMLKFSNQEAFSGGQQTTISRWDLDEIVELILTIQSFLTGNDLLYFGAFAHTSDSAENAFSFST